MIDKYIFESTKLMVLSHLDAACYKEHTGSQLELKLIKRRNDSARYGSPQEHVIGQLWFPSAFQLLPLLNPYWSSGCSFSPRASRSKVIKMKLLKTN